MRMAFEPTDEIALCNDGKYRWVYEKSLYRDLSILILLFKIFGAIVGILWLIYIVIFLFESGTDELWGITVFNIEMLLLIYALVIIGYFLYAAIMGGKYCVVFTMDEKGVKHAQHKAQVKKATLLSEITMLAGAMAGKPGVVGAGMAAARTEMYTKFSQVKTIRIDRARNTIHLSGNEVYARDEDFDFVLGYIERHCPKATMEHSRSFDSYSTVVTPPLRLKSTIAENTPPYAILDIISNSGFSNYYID